MAKYDEQTGYVVNLPGLGDFNPHGSGQTAPGSSSPGETAKPYRQDGAEVIGSPVPVTRPYDSIAGGVPLIQQSVLSTTSAVDAMTDPVSGLSQAQDPSAGTAHGPRNTKASRA
jgi:hypothetical protein